MSKQPRIVDTMIDRLAELAVGAKPYDTESGICEDLWRTVHRDANLFDWFLHTGLDEVNPLGDIHLPGKWIGERGRKRRALCYNLMVQLIASAGDYRGKYK